VTAAARGRREFLFVAGGRKSNILEGLSFLSLSFVE
jgi:hypothetical protein